MRTAPLVLAALLVLPIVLGAAAHGQALAVATAYPAPVGYSIVLSRPLGEVYGLYYGKGFTEYKADTSAGVLIAPSPPTGLALAKHERVDLKVKKAYPDVAVVFDVGGRRLLVKTGNEPAYISYYNIMYEAPPPTRVPKGKLLVIGYTIDERLPPDRVVYFIPYTRDVGITVRTWNGTRTVHLVDLLGSREACILLVKNPPKNYPWAGGVIPTPDCTRRIVTVLAKAEYQGQPIYTAFRLSVGPYSVVVSFARDTLASLVELGYLRWAADPTVHALPLDRGEAAYLLRGDRLVPVPVVEAVDYTGPSWFCQPPEGASTLLTLTWGPPRRPPLRLGPGEVYVFNASGTIYLCHGDFSYLLSTEEPQIQAPTVRQLHGPVIVYSTRAPVLVVAANGRVFYGKRLEIPYSVHSRNSLVLMGLRPRLITYSSRSVFTTPFFWLAVVLAGAFVALTLQAPKPRSPVKIVVWDIKTPEPFRTTPFRLAVREAAKHVERFGVCPDDVELAWSGVLLPYEGERPDAQRIVCPFDTNPETEAVLRRVNEVLNMGFYILKRVKPSGGYAYTRIGERTLLLYVYKQERETKPEELFLSAVRNAMKTTTPYTGAVEYLGLVIAAKPHAATALRRDLLNAGVITMDGRRGDVNAYLALRLPELSDREREELRDFLSKRVPAIIVVGDTYRGLIDYLAEETSARYEEYLKMRGE